MRNIENNLCITFAGQIKDVYQVEAITETIKKCLLEMLDSEAFTFANIGGASDEPLMFEHGSLCSVKYPWESEPVHLGEITIENEISEN